jgi:hypothetical protein
MQADLASYEGTPQLWRWPFRKYLTPIINGSWEDMLYSRLFASVRNSRKDNSPLKVLIVCLFD